MADSDLEYFLTIIGYLLLAILDICIIVFIIKKIIRACKRASLLRIMKAKLRDRNASLESIKLPPVNLQQDFIEEVLNSDVTNLKRLLDMRKLSSVDLLCIYFKRAITIGLDHALITEVNFEESMQMAKECDRIRATKYANMPVKDKEGLLFGIPISIKDLFEMKGFECNYGCGALCNNPKKEDGYAVKLLREEGAIPFIRSNIPQVSFAFECWNGIYGRGLNPWNKSRTPGGSSGGEAGLVAARCSPIGLGSDMGGSIRCPANFCGVYGFKPSSTRVSNKGYSQLTKAFEGVSCFVPVSIGPLAKSTDDVELMMKCFLNERFHHENQNKDGGDPYFIPIPWNEKLFIEKRQYRIGYLRNNDLMPVSASYLRAMDETADALRSNGHTLIEVEINFLDSIQGLYTQSVTADPNFGIFTDAVQEQGLDSELFEKLNLITGLPKCLKSIIGSVTKCLGMPRVAGLMSNTNPKTAHELLELMDSIKTLKLKFMKWWNVYNLEALIIPNLGMPAFKHGFSGDISVFGGYTMLGNLMDLPCGAIPITIVGENETIYDEIMRSNRDMIAKKAQENLNESQGLPVGVQVITPFMEEEKCVYLMKQIEEKIRFHQKHGYAV